MTWLASFDSAAIEHSAAHAVQSSNN